MRYELAELLGRGGQGAVYAIKGGRLAAKLIAGGCPTRRERLRNQLIHVKRLPLGDLALAKPLEMLRPPHTGYIMELLADMAPINTLMAPGKGQAPSVEWYLAGGGLQRRLVLLGRAANVLSRLHGKGLAYSDPSPANIFVSTECDEREVWLIDTDNIQYETSPGTPVFTPGYGAPELVGNRSGANTLTDAYSFAVIAFQTLTLTHPFIGDMVNDGEPEIEEHAFAGKLPWIEDPEDDSNRATFGVPREWVLSKKLRDGFLRAFGIGRLDPTKRPGVSEWAEIFYGAANATIECRGCSGSFYFTQDKCPWCDRERASFVIAVFYLWDPAFKSKGGILEKPTGKKTVVGHGAISDGSAFTITRRLAYGPSGRQDSDPVISVSLSGKNIKLKSLDGKEYTIVSPRGDKKTTIGENELTLQFEEPKGFWKLHFGSESTIHRVASFELKRGGIA